MKKSVLIKILIILGVVILVAIGFHLAANSILPMIKTHLGL